MHHIICKLTILSMSLVVTMRQTPTVAIGDSARHVLGTRRGVSAYLIIAMPKPLVVHIPQEAPMCL